MTPTENPSGARRPLALVLGLVALFGTAAAALVGAGGCSKPPSAIKDDGDKGAPKGKPWENAAQRLKKDTDAAAVRLALTALASELNTENKEPLPVLSEADLAKLGELVPLTPEDREELRNPTFSAHDSAYLADCLYLRDVARSLALTGAPPEFQAEVAFAWVCRQVYLHPWVRQLDPQTFATATVSPVAVLRRGYGSGLERAYVFLALLQQLELDGCLIGRPGAGAVNVEFRTAGPVPVAAVTGSAPRGPFWAVGVRAGEDVRLFDPWRGAALPVTLKQLRANPEAAKSWFEAPANAGGATLADAKAATVYLAVPVNALAPRMATAGAKFRADLGVRLGIDAPALRAAFPDPKPAFWNPPEEPFAYGRVARSLLPTDMGGADRGPTGGRLYDLYLREQLPPAVFRVPDALTPVTARTRLGATAAGALFVSFIEQPNPRERVQRGQFQDAAKDLVNKQDRFSGGLERLRLTKDADQQIREWVESVNALYDDLSRAQLNNNKEAEAGLLAQIDTLWKQPGALYLVDRASSEVGLAEAMYLLALCKHEIAERAQVRVERATGAEATRLRQDAGGQWQTALAAWRTYEGLSSAHSGFPGRAAHAQALAARAEQYAGASKR